MAMGRHAGTVDTLVEPLVQLPLSAQSQFLFLRASLQACMAHLMRCRGAWAGAGDAHTSHGCCSMAGGGGRARLALGVGEYGADIEGPDQACSTLGRQMTLPMRHGGLG